MLSVVPQQLLQNSPGNHLSTPVAVCDGTCWCVNYVTRNLMRVMKSMNTLPLRQFVHSNARLDERYL